jgi:hypothetical protein
MIARASVGMGIHRVHQDPSECWCAKAKQPALTARPTCCIAIHWLLCPSLPMFLEAQRAIGLRTAHTICAHLPLLICLVRSSPHARSTSARSIAAARFQPFTVGRVPPLVALSLLYRRSLQRRSPAMPPLAIPPLTMPLSQPPLSLPPLTRLPRARSTSSYHSTSIARSTAVL